MTRIKLPTVSIRIWTKGATVGAFHFRISSFALKGCTTASSAFGAHPVSSNSCSANLDTLSTPNLGYPTVRRKNEVTPASQTLN